MVIPGQLFVYNNTKEIGLSNSLWLAVVYAYFKIRCNWSSSESIKLHYLTLTESLFNLNQLFISESALFARTCSWYICVKQEHVSIICK